MNLREKDIKNIEEIKRFLEENNIDYVKKSNVNFTLWHDHPDGKRSFEIEYVPSIYFPISYPKYGINGVSKDYFFNLSYEAENNNNSFKFWVKDFEWENPRQNGVLKSYILHAANKTPYQFYARDCEVKEVDGKIARQFESEHCFYGKRGASLNLGLYTKKDIHGVSAGTLIMICTFGKNYFGKSDEYIEIIRVGTKKFCHVAGGFSKLLKYFLNNYKTIKIGNRDIEVKNIKFYSDYDHNIGNSMSVLGFDFVGYSGGGFVNLWLDEYKIKNREPNRHKWVMEQMKLGKCLAIPNAGVKIFALKVAK